jgi:hypothetical protein
VVIALCQFRRQWVMIFRLAPERHYFVFIDWRSSACEVFE